MDDIDYEIMDQSCIDPKWGQVLFLYPHRYTNEGFLLSDQPEVVFDRLSQFERFLSRFQASVIEDDVVYLQSSCIPYAVSFRGESAEMPGWGIYDIQVSGMSYYEPGTGNWVVLRATIPFPIHVFEPSQRQAMLTITTYDNIRTVAFEEITAFARLIDQGIIDEESRTITFSMGDGVLLVIRDMGDGTVRFDTSEEPR